MVFPQSLTYEFQQESISFHSCKCGAFVSAQTVVKKLEGERILLCCSGANIQVRPDFIGCELQCQAIALHSCHDSLSIASNLVVGKLQGKPVFSQGRDLSDNNQLFDLRPSARSSALCPCDDNRSVCTHHNPGRTLGANVLNFPALRQRPNELFLDAECVGAQLQSLELAQESAPLWLLVAQLLQLPSPSKKHSDHLDLPVPFVPALNHPGRSSGICEHDPVAALLKVPARDEPPLDLRRRLFPVC